jgi:multidrug efflux pump subunit AcrB
MRGFNLSAWALAHPAFVLFLILAFAVAGLQSYLGMGRAEDPSFTMKTMVITAAWPGATADEVQRQVADRIEEKLQELPNLDFLQTYCLPGKAVIQVQLRDTTAPRDVPHTWYLIRKKVGDIRHTLPEGVEGPFFDDEYSDVYTALYAIVGDDFGHAERKRLARDARRRLLRIKGVEKVVLFGDQPEKVFVEFSHRKLATLGVPPATVFDSLKRQNAVAAAGSVETPTDRIFVRVDGPFDTSARVKTVPVQAGGRVFRLGDIAEVRRGYEDPASFTMRYNGRPAVGIGVVMSPGENMLRLGAALEAEHKRIAADLPAGAEMHPVAFQPRVVEESVGEFERSFAEALLIVLGVGFLSLGLRSGVVVALCVPLVLAGTLVVMKALGMNLDRITLGALIIALGLLVDDAIIAIEMMLVKIEQGWDRVRAASHAWTATAFPMLVGTLVTVAGFIPIGFANSAAGEYAGGIFWVVGIALVVSWFAAVVFAPYLGVRLLPNRGAHHPARDPYQRWYYRGFRSLLALCTRHPRLVVGGTIGLFVAGLIGLDKLEKNFFPQSARPELLVELRLPEGSSFEATAAEVAKLERILDGDPEIESFTVYTGAGAPRFLLPINPDLPNPSFAKFVIVTRGRESRERLRDRLLPLFAGDHTFALPRGRILRLDLGPPVGFPVQFRVVGPDRVKVREIASRVRDVVREEPTALDAQLEWHEPSKVVRLQLDQDRARALGLSPADIADTLQTLLSGTRLSQYREGTELIDVVARAVPEERLKLDGLPDLNLITPAGNTVSLSQVATVTYQLEEPILWRRNRETVLSVRADVVDGAQPPDVTARILPRLEAIRADLPPGYRIDTGGSVEESVKANSALFSVFPVMILVMFTLLMAQVQHFAKALLVFAISPLGLVGAVLFMHLFHAPFGFVSLLGVIALAGMDMRNSVILIDQIEQDVAAGASVREAVIGATVRRARPVALTAATAILAMVPLTRSVFWGPMAVAIMGGLSVATFLTLINLPALYVLCFRARPPAPPEQLGAPAE